MDFSKLRDVRKMRKMRVCEMAKKAGMSRNNISKIERGVGNPRWRTLERMAEILEVQIVIMI